MLYAIFDALWRSVWCPAAVLEEGKSSAGCYSCHIHFGHPIRHSGNWIPLSMDKINFKCKAKLYKIKIHFCELPIFQTDEESNCLCFPNSVWPSTITGLRSIQHRSCTSLTGQFLNQRCANAEMLLASSRFRKMNSYNPFSSTGEQALRASLVQVFAYLHL